MKTSHKFLAFGSVALILASLATAGWKQDKAPDALDLAAVHKMLDDLGYASTEKGKSYQIKITQGGLDIPISVELSESGTNIWLTTFLGNDADRNAARALILLKANAEIQPSQFYVTKNDDLKCSLVIENREVTKAFMRTRIQKLANDIVENKAAWQK